MMSSLWATIRNRPQFHIFTSLFVVKIHFKDVHCSEFFDLTCKDQILQNIHASEACNKKKTRGNRKSRRWSRSSTKRTCKIHTQSYSLNCFLTKSSMQFSKVLLQTVVSRRTWCPRKNLRPAGHHVNVHNCCNSSVYLAYTHEPKGNDSNERTRIRQKNFFSALCFGGVRC